MNLFRFESLPLFHSDGLAWVMTGLILFVIANVLAYSRRYLAGDRHQNRHYSFIVLIAISALTMVFADHLFVLLMAWAVSNGLLVQLMIHKKEWLAARNSGLLAARTFLLGFLMLGAGFWLLAEGAGTSSIRGIIEASSSSSPATFEGLLLVAVAALSQSAAWPFHRWLTSSLNSPTPVSALMHAGLVNGGGFILVRLAALYAAQPLLLHAIFAVGLVTAVIGSFWKLLQTDLKRMLACSTMGQMGFMLMQCGMGLFAPAVSHLCWHGVFKAYLFLNAGSAVQEKRVPLKKTDMTPLKLMVAGLVGLCGTLTFSLTYGNHLSLSDTSGSMLALAFMAATQVAIGLLNKPLTVTNLTGTLLAGLGVGGMYGGSIWCVDRALTPLHAIEPRPMDAIYMAGLSVLVVLWVAMVLDLPARLQSHSGWKRIYMAALNASQPHPDTVTGTRTAYQS